MSNSKYLYKYLPLNYGESLFNKGIVHFKNAAYFCSIEEDGIRGDKHDGKEIFNTQITIKDSGGEHVILTKAFTVRSQDELKSTYIYCVSKVLSQDLFNKFNSNCCVVIKNIEEFQKRIANNSNNVNLKVDSQFLIPKTNEIKSVKLGISFETNLIYDDIVYFDDDKTVDWVRLKADIRQKFFCKRKSLYQWQEEYRILLQPKGNMEILCSQDDKLILDNLKKYNSPYDIFPTGINLHIGSIEDIAEIIKN